jgi:THO complex subunit 1
VLNTFEAQPLSDDDGKLNNLNEEEDAAFNIKYLTSSKLMGLEVKVFEQVLYFPFIVHSYDMIILFFQLKDPSFRRHILVQCLIFFDYLKVHKSYNTNSN